VVPVTKRGYRPTPLGNGAIGGRHQTVLTVSRHQTVVTVSRQQTMLTAATVYKPG
jgi:hypothetical protein